MTKKSQHTSSSMGEDEINVQTSKGNACAVLDADKFIPPYSIIVEYLNHCFLTPAITRRTDKMPLTHVHYAYMSATEVTEDDENLQMAYQLVDDSWKFLHKDDFLKIIGLTPPENATLYRPDDSLIHRFLSNVYYQGAKSGAEFKKKLFPAVWELLGTCISRCLTGRTGTADFLSREIIDIMFGVYTGTNVDVYSIIWNNFRQHSLPQTDKEGIEIERTEIKMARFWALVVDAKYKELGIDIPRIEKEPLVYISQFKSIVIKAEEQERFGGPISLPPHMTAGLDANSKHVIAYKDLIAAGSDLPRPIPFSGFLYQVAKQKKVSLLAS